MWLPTNKFIVITVVLCLFQTHCFALRVAKVQRKVVAVVPRRKRVLTGYGQLSPFRSLSRAVNETKLKLAPSSYLSGATNPQVGVAFNGLLALVLYATRLYAKALTKAGLLHAMALGIGLWSFLGPQGWLYTVSYFIMGITVTKVQFNEKEALGIAEKRGGARGPENVWGSAATAMICAFLSFYLPSWSHVFKVGYAAAMATKLSDTCGSEIGKAYGTTCYLPTTMKKVSRGTEGAMSVEGTLSGIIGSLLIGLLGLQLGILSSLREVYVVTIAAFLGTTIESFIGAIFQDKVGWLTNELVNFINTLVGAVTAILFTVVL